MKTGIRVGTVLVVATRTKPATTIASVRSAAALALNSRLLKERINGTREDRQQG
jgi:hypothetical protein